MNQIAKLFANGRSQAVRLPVEFRFEGTQVFIRRDLATGDVILSKRPQNWDSFFAAAQGLEISEDFLSPVQRDQEWDDRDPFKDWAE